MNKLYLGDNLDILRKIKDESVDLICTDPPSNSGPGVFSTKDEGFTNIWTWDKAAEDARVDIKERSESCKVYKALNECLSGYDMLLSNAVPGNKGAKLAYLTFMGPRLVEMHRILTKSGSMYMHCDPTISHYLKVLMDAIWNHSNGQENESFKNEIVWYYRRFSGASRNYRKMHDIILFYTKTENYVFTTPKPVYEDKLFRRDKGKDIIDKKPDRMPDDKGQYKRIRTSTDDAFLRDVWDDIGILSLMVSERLGYPTQKPSLLYTRMIETSSEDGDVVLDPFCGSGTTLDAAQALKRKWIGIDSSIIALDVTERRLKDKYSLKPSEDYEIVGFPTNFKGVRDIASKETNHTILSNWAATRLNLTPSKDADNDTETTLWSLRDKKREDVRIAAEVKVGKLGPDQVRQLQKFIENDTADIVILITLEPVTSEMREIADNIEKFKYKGLSFPRLQFWQITDKFFDDPESVYDVLQLPGKLRVKPTKKGDRLFPDIQFDSERNDLMTSQHPMQFPFTTQEEIHDWAARYIEGQSEKRQRQEQAVIDIKQAVNTRQTPDIPGGYLLTAELREMAQWKSRFTPSKIDNNRPGLIEDVTREAFRLNDDWEKLEKLTEIEGVAESVASVILHLYDRKKYPILDKHALCAIGIDHREVNYDAPFWRKYVNLCRTKAERYDVSMRTLDRALWKFGKWRSSTQNHRR